MTLRKILGTMIKVVFMAPVLFLIFFVWVFILPTIVVGFSWAFIKFLIGLV